MTIALVYSRGCGSKSRSCSRVSSTSKIVRVAAAMRPFVAHVPFAPEILRRLLDDCVNAALAAGTGEEWLAEVDQALRRWLARALVSAQRRKAVPLSPVIRALSRTRQRPESWWSVWSPRST